MSYLRNYAKALRCIGQELERRGIEVFQLKSHANQFRLQAGDPDPPYTAIIEATYSEQDLEDINQRGYARRGKSAAEVRFDGIPEALRAVGEYVDRNGFLRKIDNSCPPVADQPVIEVEYQTRSGDVHSETLAMNVVREAIERMYKRRSRT